MTVPPSSPFFFTDRHANFPNFFAILEKGEREVGIIAPVPSLVAGLLEGGHALDKHFLLAPSRTNQETNVLFAPVWKQLFKIWIKSFSVKQATQIIENWKKSVLISAVFSWRIICNNALGDKLSHNFCPEMRNTFLGGYCVRIPSWSEKTARWQNRSSRVAQHWGEVSPRAMGVVRLFGNIERER